jgi:outer membrane protein assembly factor BamB
MGTPLFQDGHFYVADNYGEFQCVEAATGKPIWRTRQPTGETEWGSSVHLTPNGNRVFLFKDRGQLMVAKLSREATRNSVASATNDGIGACESVGTTRRR